MSTRREQKEIAPSWIVVAPNGAIVATVGSEQEAALLAQLGTGRVWFRAANA